MRIENHTINNKQIAEIISEGLIINSIEDGVDLMGNIYYQGFDAVIISENNITPDFFDLRTGIAGEILQKFATYRIRLFVITDTSKYDSKSLRDFIYESNKGAHVNFVNSVKEAILLFQK